MSYTVKIDGISIPLHDHAWAVTGGYTAPIQPFRVPNKIASDLLARKSGQEVDIQLDQTTVKRAILVGNSPSNEEWYQNLLFTDVRWYLTRKWMLLDANVKQRVGDNRLVGTSLEQAVVVPSVRYAPWSLNNGTPFDWASFANRSIDLARNVGPISIEWVVDQGSLSIESKTIEESTIDCPMPLGLAKAISAVPGRNIYTDLDGVIHVYDAVPGAEKSIIDRLRTLHLVGNGDMTWIDMSASRPADGYRVFTTPELEVRLDYNFGTGSVNADDPYLEPVFKVTDLTLNVPASSNYSYPARSVAMGSWITTAEAFEAWGAGGRLNRKLSNDIIRDGYLKGSLVQEYVYSTPPDPDLVWHRRIDMVMKYWRRAFRVNPKFWARVLRVSDPPVMAAVWDQATGTRARSPAFVNMSKRYEIRWLLANQTQTAFNDNTSYATSGLIASCKPQTAVVEWEDPDQGILTVMPDLRGGGFSEAAPSLIDGNEPNLDPAKNNRVIVDTWATRTLISESSFKLSTIISMTPAAPADTRRLYYVDVPLSDAAEALGVSDSLRATGPRQELRTHGATARIAWSDAQDDKDRILAFFGANGPDVAVSATDANLTARTLVAINHNDEVQPLSKAYAGCDLYLKLDHYEGRFSVPMNSELAPIGSVSEVVHRVTTATSRTTCIAGPLNPGSAPNPMDLLPKSAHDALLRIIAEEKS